MKLILRVFVKKRKCVGELKNEVVNIYFILCTSSSSRV